MKWKLLKDRLAQVFKRRKKIRKKKYKFFLCLDIGTEAVKILILGLSSLDKKITVFGNGMEYLDGYKLFGRRSFESERIKKTISQAIKNAHSNVPLFLMEKDLKKRIQEQKEWPVLLGLPPDVLRARIVSCSFLRKNPKTKILEKEEALINRQISETAKKEISQAFSKESGILASDIHWVYSKISQIKIDGYPVSSFRGYQGRELEFKVLATFLPRYYWESIQGVIDSLGFKIFKTVHLAQGILPLCKERNGLFLDVGGKITQLFKIKNCKIDRIDEFEGGGDMFVQNLSRTLGLDKETARNFSEKYSRKKLSPEVQERIKAILSEEKIIWHNNLKAKLKKMSFKDPSLVFLSGGGSCFPEIQEALLEKKESFGNSKIKYIRLRDLEDINDATKKLSHPQYISSLLLTLTL